jgi:hypothetical protein
MTGITELKYKEAVSLYGSDVVDMVLQLVEVSDPDGMFSQFEDMDMYDEAECVSFFFFD